MSRPGVRSVAVFILALAVGACGGGAPDTPPDDPADTLSTLGEPDERIPDPPIDAPSLLASVEEQLLEDAGALLPFEVQSEGGVDVDLQGELDLGTGGRLRLHATGTFAGRAVDALLVSDGLRLYWVVDGNAGEADLPTHLREGVVLGFSRMGILHNLARLISGSPPDGTDGSAPDWVRVTEPTHAGSDASVPTAVAVHFGIVVADQPAGEATLWLDPATRAPLLRRQTVRFPEGEMRVTERYLDPAVHIERPDSLFIRPQDPASQ